MADTSATSPATPSSKAVEIRPLTSGDVRQIVPLLAENYKTQDFRVAFFKHVMRQPAPALGLVLFGAIAFFSWGNVTLAIVSPILLYVYLAALYHFRVNASSAIDRVNPCPSPTIPVPHLLDFNISH